MSHHIGLAMLAALAAAGPASPVDDLRQKAYAAQRQSHYLEALSLFQQVACQSADPNAKLDIENVRKFIAPDAPDDAPAKAETVIGPDDIAAIKRATARDALDEIVARAAKTRITILNEHHMQPRSRAFAYQVARRLRPLGYDVLAAETFANNPDPRWAERPMIKLLADGHATQETGFYTADPVFAGFVRGALALGYRPANYETTNYGVTGDADERIAAREQDQADNLVKVLARYPNSKILVYVGFGHAAEEPARVQKGKALWMAARLKRQTGIDPLTIDQTVFVAGSVRKPADPLLALAESKAHGRSVTLLDGDKPLIVGSFAGVVDLQVIHPLVPDRRGRAGWWADLGRAPRKAPANLRPVSGAVLLQAFADKDSDDAVPLDQVMWEAGKGAPTLMLPPGRIRYRVEPAPSTVVCPAKA